jgi:hypothetical protein
MNISEQGNWMDKLFHKKLSGFELPPEDHIWEGIVKKLDESQRRPGLFGNWWTVLLSLILLLMVTGASAYVIYRKINEKKNDKNQNKDLPYHFQNQNEEETAYIETNSTRTILTTPHHQTLNQIIKKKESGSKKISTITINRKEIPETNSVNKNSFQTTGQLIIQEHTTNPSSQFQQEIKANDLIVSTDLDFIADLKSENNEFSYLPIKHSLINKNDHYLNPIFIDGCNVYKNNKSHFFLDVYYAPEIANRSLTTKDPALQAYVQERENTEKPILSYSAGVRASFVLGNGLSLRTGLSYSKNSERFDYIKETQKITKEIKDQNGNVIRTEITELVIMDKIYNQYKFLDIPILIGYEKDLKDFVLSLNGGIGFNISSTQSGIIYKDIKNPKTFYNLDTNGDNNQTIFRNSAGISLIGSVGLNYKYNERIMLLLEPSVRYYLRSLSDPSNPVNQDYLFMGINIGLRYRIK